MRSISIDDAHRITLFNHGTEQSDIADFLGLTAETVSRTLTKLANQGIISRHSGRIRILDTDALEDVAAGDHSV